MGVSTSIVELMITSLEKAYRKLFSTLMVVSWCVDPSTFPALEPKTMIEIYCIQLACSANSLARQRAQRLNRTEVFDFHRCHADQPFVQVDHLASQHGIVTRIEQ